METIAKFNIGANQIEVTKEEEVKITGAESGCAPWLIGTRYVSVRYYWFVNGKYTETFSWNKNKNYQEMLIRQFAQTHKLI